MEFLEEADADKDGYLNQTEFFTKLGYQWFKYNWFLFIWLIILSIIIEKSKIHKN